MNTKKSILTTLGMVLIVISVSALMALSPNKIAVASAITIGGIGLFSLGTWLMSRQSNSTYPSSPPLPKYSQKYLVDGLEANIIGTKPDGTLQFMIIDIVEIDPAEYDQRVQKLDL